MILSASATKGRFVVPEVVQTSGMDCGPACLKSLLQGFGVPVSYGRLREACQTDVDGTSIDTLEEIAVQLGLEAEQVMVPVDHVLLPEAQALPAIIVVRLPSGFTHFVVAWRCHLNRVVQIMDPATGRRWSGVQQFLDEVYVHTFPVPAAAWREWAGSDDFLGPLRHRLADLGLAAKATTPLIETALADPGWRSLAVLDAATRMAGAIVRSGGIDRGRQAAAVLQSFFEQGCAAPAGETDVIPDPYWSVRPAPTEPDEPVHLLLRGAVLVRVLGRRAVEVADRAREEKDELSPELVAALEEPTVPPWRQLWRFLRADGLLAPTALVVALALVSTGFIIEALLFRGLLDLGGQLATFEQRLAAMAVLLVFVGLNLLLQLYIDIDVLRLGRRLEARLRMAFLDKIPRLNDRYFRSRPVSDMAERSHNIHQLRLLPDLGKEFIDFLFQVVLTAAGMIWIHPPLAPVIVLSTILAIAVPMAMLPPLAEQDLRVRTHVGALGRYYLDAMLGLVAVRTHRAERPIRREHETLLAEWVDTKIRFLRFHIISEGVQIVIVLTGVAWIVLDYVARGEGTGGVLLLAYWGLNLPFRGRQVVRAARYYAIRRNITLRLFEPLGAPQDDDVAAQDPGSELAAAQEGGLDILMEGVGVRAAGHTILRDINLHVGAGSHVAIVGPSGAGKTSLVSLLLGWHRPAGGRVCIDGQVLDGSRLGSLRRETAWVDPAVQIWNRSFLDNLAYGNEPDSRLPFAQAIDQADLRQVLESLPDGLQTPLGEGGGLVSGGEGQRVRLGRAMLRPGVRLVILDEPFRGLGRNQRHELLNRARQLWSDATLLCITHDVSETQAFERVLVMERGQIVEDGDPADLAQRTGSRYRAMLEAETRVRTESWGSQVWRKLWLEDGHLRRDSRQEEAG